MSRFEKKPGALLPAPIWLAASANRSVDSLSVSRKEVACARLRNRRQFGGLRPGKLVADPVRSGVPSFSAISFSTVSRYGELTSRQAFVRCGVGLPSAVSSVTRGSGTLPLRSPPASGT